MNKKAESQESIWNDCNIIMDHYGPIHQYNQLTEEVTELYDAIISGDTDYKNIVSECADVYIMLKQFYEIDGVLRRIVTEKLNRQHKRILEEVIKDDEN